MPHITVPKEIFRRLAKRATAFNISVEDLVKPALDLLAGTGTPPPEPPLPLTGEACRAELGAWKRDAENQAGRYPPEFILDDSREIMFKINSTTERADYFFRVGENRYGPPFIVLEPRDKGLDVLGRGVLALKLREGMSMEQAHALAIRLNEHILRISYTSVPDNR